MSKRLTPYGSASNAGIISKVGKPKSPLSLAARMPSPELAAKVGGPVTASISSVMSPPEPFAGIDIEGIVGARSRRVQRRNAYT